MRNRPKSVLSPMARTQPTLRTRQYSVQRPGCVEPQPASQPPLRDNKPHAQKPKLHTRHEAQHTSHRTACTPFQASVPSVRSHKPQASARAASQSLDPSPPTSPTSDARPRSCRVSWACSAAMALLSQQLPVPIPPHAHAQAQARDPTHCRSPPCNTMRMSFCMSFSKTSVHVEPVTIESIVYCCSRPRNWPVTCWWKATCGDTVGGERGRGGGGRGGGKGSEMESIKSESSKRLGEECVSNRMGMTLPARARLTVHLEHVCHQRLMQRLPLGEVVQVSSEGEACALA